jgi:hypothetical protein
MMTCEVKITRNALFVLKKHTPSQVYGLSVCDAVHFIIQLRMFLINLMPTRKKKAAGSSETTDSLSSNAEMLIYF